MSCADGHLPCIRACPESALAAGLPQDRQNQRTATQRALTINDQRGLPRRNLLASTAIAVGATLMTLDEARAQGVTLRRGGTLTTMLTPEPPVLVLGVNNQGPTQVAASKI